jgi:hypothetical protein
MSALSQPCKKCATPFIIDDQDQSFYAQLELPHPTHCPDCRHQRRLTWRNERNLYPRKCDGTGEDIISVYSADKAFPVYTNDYWYSDAWDPTDYGRDFDFSRPFFEQFEELMNAVPQLARSVLKNDNCDYVNQCGWCKDCYLIFEADHNRDCYYSSNIFDSRDCMDILHGTNNELCYQCVDCHDSYNLKFSQDSKGCSDSWFLKNCIGSKNCFGSVNLRNKEYYFLNKPYTKEEYFRKLASVDLSRWSALEAMREEFQIFAKDFPHKYSHGIQNDDSIGDYLNHNQRCKDSFDVQRSQDCRYVFDSRNLKNVYDLNVFGGKGGVEIAYESHEVGERAQRVFFSDQVWDGANEIWYSKLINGGHHLFGCVSMKKATYAIFNKTYTANEYEQLSARIREHMKETGEWGEFFPSAISPYGYNETVAPYYFPLEKEAATTQGFNWFEEDQRSQPAATATTPDSIESVRADIVNEVLSCQDCAKPYRLVQQEIRFLKQQNLPLSPYCHNCRHAQRMKQRNPRRLWARQCDQCGTDLNSSYAPDRPETILCETCYGHAVD